MSITEHTISATLDQKTVEPFTGEFVIIALRYPGGREDHGLKGRVLCAGSVGFIIEGENFCWPTSVRYSDLVTIAADPRTAATRATGALS